MDLTKLEEIRMKLQSWNVSSSSVIDVLKSNDHDLNESEIVHLNY